MATLCHNEFCSICVPWRIAIQAGQTEGLPEWVQRSLEEEQKPKKKTRKK